MLDVRRVLEHNVVPHCARFALLAAIYYIIQYQQVNSLGEKQRGHQRELINVFE